MRLSGYFFRTAFQDIILFLSQTLHYKESNDVKIILEANNICSSVIEANKNLDGL